MNNLQLNKLCTERPKQHNRDFLGIISIGERMMTLCSSALPQMFRHILWPKVALLNFALEHLMIEISIESICFQHFFCSAAAAADAKKGETILLTWVDVIAFWWFAWRKKDHRRLLFQYIDCSARIPFKAFFLFFHRIQLKCSAMNLSI